MNIMESEKPTKWYGRLRVDGAEDEIVIKLLDTTCSKYLLVHHLPGSGENPHYHAYLETHIAQGNFSNKVKTTLSVKGSDLSNKKCDFDKRDDFLSYLWNTKKGNAPRLVKQKGFTEEQIEGYKSKAKEIADTFAKVSRSTKPTQYDVAQIVIQKCKDSQHETHIWHPRTIYAFTIDTLKEAKMMARPNHIRDIIATVMAYSGNNNAEKLIEDISLKYFLG